MTFLKWLHDNYRIKKLESSHEYKRIFLMPYRRCVGHSACLAAPPHVTSQAPPGAKPPHVTAQALGARSAGRCFSLPFVDAFYFNHHVS